MIAHEILIYSLALIQIISFLSWIGAIKFNLWIKAILKKFTLIPSYCKDCGRNITDFICEDYLWVKVMKEDKHKEVCYDCFCKRSKRNYIIVLPGQAINRVNH